MWLLNWIRSWFVSGAVVLDGGGASVIDAEGTLSGPHPDRDAIAAHHNRTLHTNNFDDHHHSQTVNVNTDQTSSDEPSDFLDEVTEGQDRFDQTSRSEIANFISCEERVPTGYESSLDYLFDELSRAALLVKAYVIRRRAAEEAGQSPVDLVTELPFGWKGSPTESKWQCSQHDQLIEAAKLELYIAERLKRTSPEISHRFPLVRLLQIIAEDTRLTPRGEDRDAAEDRRNLISRQRDALLVSFLDYHFSVYRGALCKLSTDDGTIPGGLSVGMAAEICQPSPQPGDDPLSLFESEIPLIRDRYVEIGEANVEPSRRRLQIDPAIVSFLFANGDNDAELQGLVTRYDSAFRLDQLHADAATIGHLRALTHRVRKYPAVILFHGPSGGPFVSAARAVLSSTERPSLLVADVARAASLPNWNEWTARVYRQARLERSAILWNSATAIIEAARTDTRWQQLFPKRSEALVFITANVAWDPDGASNQRVSTFVRVEFPIPSGEIRQQIWRQQLTKAGIRIPPDQLEVTLDLLESFQFTEGQISDAIMIARGLWLSDDQKSPDISEHLYDACRRVSARGLVSFTQRVPPRKFGPDKHPLEAIILSPEGRQQLHELHDRIENLNRVYYEYGFGNSLGLGRGLIALFSGPSGTGKTLAATVLASCHERDLYKVDMSAVVSKYVGETEKNLARVFSDAQSANALLFFDEADAIFGKRGEIDKAQDRWANMEINYLLQRVEEFSGVVILATNLKQNIDEAFLRRVQVLIDFKVPDAQDRQKILLAMFPCHVDPPSESDLRAFSEQFELTGGNLKNVAVDAAFRAIKEQHPKTSSDHSQRLQIQIEHLVLAAAREYRKLSKPVTIASFGRRFFQMVKEGLNL